ncbi:pectate lyase family protein [Neobacillus bataviensis]|uniref:pectate lyase family protein n=1 Tax=Neobacillus bataviensis TaxID=220685 RepID=UPI001CBE4680|nr:hypothetical protein [Neobacillus bataviensis]
MFSSKVKKGISIALVKKGISIALATTLAFSSFGYVPVFANDSPKSAASNELVANEAGTWFETAFATWTGRSEAKYEVYVRGTNVIDWRDGSQITGWLEDWTLVNDSANAKLVRVVDPARNTWRVDIPGLPQGEYEIQVRDENGTIIHTFTNLKTCSFVRNGAAFLPSNDSNGFSGSNDFALDGAIGGYLPDGRVDPNATIIYVTHENMRETLAGPNNSTPNVIAKREGAPNEKTPLIIRFLGTVGSFERVNTSVSNSGTQAPPGVDSNRMLRVNSGNGNITFEGVGPDATIFGWGINTGGSHNVVIRNLTFGQQYASAIVANGGGVNVRASNVWIHNNTFGYGQNRYLALGHDPDNAKGDGSTDISNNLRNYTVSYNHYEGSSKAMLIGGNASEMDPHYGTIDHNWFEGSEERTPRVRGGRLHVFNNLYEDIQGHPYHNQLKGRNTGYGIGAGHNANIWAEGNIFDNVNFPFIRSRQGHARGFAPIDYLPGPGESDTANAGFNHLFGDQPGFIITKEVVTEGDFPESVEDFRNPSDVMTYGTGEDAIKITDADLDSLKQAALNLQPNIVYDGPHTFFDPKLDIGVVVAKGSTTTNPPMTATGGNVLAAQLDWAFRPTDNTKVWSTETSDDVAALRTHIETYSGVMPKLAPTETPVAPIISNVVINDQSISNNKVVVYDNTFTIDWENKDVLTESYEIQWDQGNGKWKTLKQVVHNALPKRYITQDIDQFAHLKAILAEASNGEVYQFRVRALNAFGSSEWSDVFVVDTVKEAIPSAVVNNLNGNENELIITINETYFDGTTNDADPLKATLKIKNNSAGTYKIGRYNVYVDTKGNTQVREIYIVE